ncbi:ester hydrolase C11orf54 [Folsomia candida]|uniref:DUF1907 domain-containing protein n=1 Tax=Folsomia candida TaxID=158441 RepID=A0A226EZ34_FOLCA|nr:ester hydrolase C11orf54 [Folsomia candida]OXA62799.1 hypothetical protein Fcan01_03965 [Folsomia candida]
MATKFPVEEFVLPSVDIEDICKALNENLKAYFQNVDVNVVDCPNLAEPPYNLATNGIGGYCVIADIGGVPYLIPLVQRDKVYDLRTLIPECVGADKFPEGWYISGAGAGPFKSQGSNCELIVNMYLSPDDKVVNRSKVALTSSQNETDLTVKTLSDTETDSSLLVNVLVSSGAGKVLDIKVSHKLDPATNFTTILRDCLNKKFTASTPVGLGGLFTVDRAPTKIHVMRDFSTKPLLTDNDVEEWLKFFRVEPPFMSQSILVSTDPGLDLRVEHSHGWTTHSGPAQAGHYHYDTAPQDVQYHGIYAVASKIVRIDRPKETHNIGRD